MVVERTYQMNLQVKNHLTTSHSCPRKAKFPRLGAPDNSSSPWSCPARFFFASTPKKDAKNIGIWKAGDSKKHQISVAIHVPKQQKNAYCIWCMVTPLKNDGKNVKLQIPRVSSLQQPAIRLFGLHGRCRMTSYRIAARPFKLESCRCFFGTPKKKPETHSFQCLPPPQQLGFSLLCRCFVFGPAQTVGVLFCWRKKRPKPIQNDSLGEALDRFFCISSWTVQWRFQASHSEGKACGVFQVNSLLEKTHTHTHTRRVLGWVSDCFLVKQEDFVEVLC